MHSIFNDLNFFTFKIKVTEWNDRYQRVCNKLTELDQELRIFLRNFDVISLTTVQISVNKIFY